MQILPHQKSSSPSMGDALFAQWGQNTTGTDSFEEYLTTIQAAQRAVDEGLNHSVTSALAADSQTTAPLQEAPYSVKSKTDTGTYTLEEVCFSKPELVELRQELVNAGAPPETLERFDKLVNQPDGATLAQVTASLRPLNSPPQLSDDDKNTLKGLLKKIDSTGALEEKIMGLLEGGQALAAWKHLSQAINGLDPSARFSLDKSEIGVLGKALGLSDTGQQHLLSGFGNAQSLELTSGQFKHLLSPAQGDLMQRESNQKKLDAALEKTLTPILQKTRKRMKAEQDATSLQSRQVEQSKIMINKTVTGTANTTMESTATKGDKTTDQDALDQANMAQQIKKQGNSQDNPVGTAEQMRGQGASEVKPDAKAGAKDVKTVNPDAYPAEGKAVDGQQKNASQTQRDPGNLSDPKNGDPHGAGNKNSGNTGWESVLNKVEVRPQTATTQNTLVGNVQGIHTGLQTAGASPTTTATGTPAHISRQVASQVEQAMLSAMRDGSKKLELQLTPGDLGNITLTLSTRNGEVSAIIRSERTETADAMVRQLDVLRTNLEQQGIKVDKLEVQTQAQNQQNDSWQNLQQHNNQQEEHARREQLDRLRNLGKVRNSSTSANDTSLEQGLQLTSRTAENAAQSLHIVA